VFDRVTITYRGATYEIGRGRDFYGIWMTGVPRSQPVERWPETPEGWSAAWTKFASIETPDAVVPVGRRTPGAGSAAAPAGENPGPFAQVQGQVQVQVQDTTRPAAGRPGGPARAVAAAALLGAGVVLGVAGLFPAYIGGSSLAHQADQLIPHVAYLTTWTAGAVLVLLGGVRLRLGALLSLGLSAVTFGLFLADAGTAIAGGGNAFGAGLTLSLLGWLACAAGSLLAFLAQPAGLARRAGARAGGRGSLARPRGAQVGPFVMLVVAGLGTAAAFAPAWDSFTLRTAAGQSQSLTAGNAFSNPGLAIVGDVAVMAALVAVVIVAALWRPVRHGAVLLAGAFIAMAAQAVSAIVQASGTASPTQFGISSSEASQIGLTISSGLTPAFWIYCGFLVALGVSCAWMLFTPQPAPVPDPPAAAGAYARDAAAPDDLAGEEPEDDDAGQTDDDAVMPDFEPAPRHTAGGAGDLARPAGLQRPAA
jgi:hypothetical protein